MDSPLAQISAAEEIGWDGGGAVTDLGSVLLGLGQQSTRPVRVRLSYAARLWHFVLKTRGEPNSFLDVHRCRREAVWQWHVDAVTRTSAECYAREGCSENFGSRAGDWRVSWQQAARETGRRGEASTTVVMNAMATILRTKVDMDAWNGRGRWGTKGRTFQPGPSLRRYLRPTLISSSSLSPCAIILFFPTMSISNKLSITDLDLKSKKVLIRVDFNVPIQDGKITNPAVSRSPSPSRPRSRSSTPSSALSPLSPPSSMP